MSTFGHDTFKEEFLLAVENLIDNKLDKKYKNKHWAHLTKEKKIRLGMDVLAYLLDDDYFGDECGEAKPQ